MWGRYWGARYWARRYWAKGGDGAAAPEVTGGSGLPWWMRRKRWYDDTPDVDDGPRRTMQQALRESIAPPPLAAPPVVEPPRLAPPPLVLERVVRQMIAEQTRTLRATAPAPRPIARADVSADLDELNAAIILLM